MSSSRFIRDHRFSVVLYRSDKLLYASTHQILIIDRDTAESIPSIIPKDEHCSTPCPVSSRVKDCLTLSSKVNHCLTLSHTVKHCQDCAGHPPHLVFVELNLLFTDDAFVLGDEFGVSGHCDFDALRIDKRNGSAIVIRVV